MRREACLAVSVLFLLVGTPADAQPRRVAVLDFANASRDPSLEWLGPAVAETVTTKLHAIRGLQLIERMQLYKVLTEQKLSLTDLVDPSQAIKVGKLLNAEQVVLGSFAAFVGTVRFTARFVDVATGAIVATSQANGVIDPRNPGGLWSAFDQLAQAAIDSLNTRVAIVQGIPQPAPAPPAQRIEPTPEERARFARVPTTSLEAQEAYGRGLAANRRQQWRQAIHHYERATSLDPDYARAWKGLSRALFNLGRWADAFAAAERADRLYASMGDEPGRAWALNDMGDTRRKQGRYTEAVNYLERSLRLMERLGDEAGLAVVLNNIGNAEAERGRHSRKAVARAR